MTDESLTYEEAIGRRSNDKITPPEGLERALAAALVDAGFSIPSNGETYAEQLLYSAPMQEWLWGQTAGRDITATTAEDAREPREPLKVTCTVTVDLSSPHAAADALSRVPINAKVVYSTQSALLGLVTMGTLVATWEEER